MSKTINDRVKWSLRDGVARITLAGGPGNSLDTAMNTALLTAAMRVAVGAADGNVRVAVLDAEGDMFCAGGDLRAFAQAADRRRQVEESADVSHRAVLALSTAEAPI